MLLKDDHEEKRRKSIKRERRKVREKGGKEAPMQMENIKMYEKTEKSEKTVFWTRPGLMNREMQRRQKGGIGADGRFTKRRTSSY